jgi:hypothetical protein
MKHIIIVKELELRLLQAQELLQELIQGESNSIPEARRKRRRDESVPREPEENTASLLSIRCVSSMI